MTTPLGTYLLHAKNGKRYILSNQLECMSLLMAFMHEVLNGMDTYFKTILTPTGRKYLRTSSLGEHMSRLGRYSLIYSRHYIFHPALVFFFDQYRQHDIQQFDDLRAGDRAANGVKKSEMFDDFVAIMRARAAESGLRKRIADWDSKAKKNRKRMREFETKLFDRKARLVVIRLDLGYQSAIFNADEIEAFVRDDAVDKRLDLEQYWGGIDLSTLEPLDARVGFEEVQRDRKRLFSNMKGKPSLFEHLVAYVWCIECTPKAGYHMHVTLFFDGSEVREHEWLAHQIGDYWVNDITGGRGRFHNCNRDWDETSPHYGLGVINHYDDVKRANLREKVLPYLAKDSQPILALPYAGCRSFGTGFAHRDMSKGRGRPRIKGANRSDQPGASFT